jgi:2-succinyl-5-enolpyruvyl-6-hydroxy-3-cyclohexene-1-carboxylate synthase
MNSQEASSNVLLAAQVLEDLVRAGVRELVLCAGSRNSPLLAMALSEPRLRCWHHFEERSAAFFALGRIQATGRPVAVSTTSGTAVAELLPACIEAHYSRWPLVLLTADRPHRFHGTGSPQSIEQVGLFGVYAETDLAHWSAQRPLQINLPFEEPLLPEKTLPALKWDETPLMRRTAAPALPGAHALERLLGQAKAPLVIVGRLPHEQRAGVENWLVQLGAPVYAEALSGLRESVQLGNHLIKGGDAHLKHGPWDAVLRIGSVPTLRFWRDLEEVARWKQLPVVSLSREPFSGLARSSELLPLEAYAGVHPQLPHKDAGLVRAFHERDARLAAKLEILLTEEADSEAACVRQLSQAWPGGSLVFLGNSLPIREWDLVAIRQPKSFDVRASRGANGIDGQLSAFLGLVEPGRAHFALLGDLTLLYDAAAPYIVAQLPERDRFQICVINNQGGRIFERLPAFQQHFEAAASKAAFINPHAVDFQAWAKMWQLDAQHFRELRPNAEASDRFWARYAQSAELP